MASISDELAFRRKQQRSSRTAIGAFEDQETKGSHTLYGMSIKRVLTVKTEVKVRWPQVKPEQDRWHLHGKIKNTHSV
jgi:hypothetical protein